MIENKLYENAERRVDEKISFYHNLYSYIIVNAILALINWLFTPEFWWVIFPILFWGIGVLGDFIKTFVIFGVNYRERKIAEEMEKIKNES